MNNFPGYKGAEIAAKEMIEMDGWKPLAERIGHVEFRCGLCCWLPDPCDACRENSKLANGEDS